MNNSSISQIPQCIRQITLLPLSLVIFCRFYFLTHWGRVTHISVGNLTSIGSDNGLSPDRRQAIIWTNAGILSIGPLGTNFSEILASNITFSFTKMYLKVSSAKGRPFCLGLNVLTYHTKGWNQNPVRPSLCDYHSQHKTKSFPKENDNHSTCP